MLRYKEQELNRWVDQFIAGQQSAIEQIINLIASDIVNIAYYYLGNLEDAKDVCQETCLKLYQKLSSFRGASKVTTWIYRITVNTCIDYLRKGKKTVVLEEAVIKDNKDQDQMIAAMDEHDQRLRIVKTLEALPLRQKNVVILKHFQGLTLKQISKVLGCSESSAKTHLYRGLENLKTKLGGRL